MDSELAVALHSHQAEAQLPPPAAPGETMAARQRKLRRMALVRQQEDASGGRMPQLSVRREVPGGQVCHAGSGMMIFSLLAGAACPALEGPADH